MFKDLESFKPVASKIEKFFEKLRKEKFKVNYACYGKIKATTKIKSYKLLPARLACLVVGKEGKPGKGAPAEVHEESDKLKGDWVILDEENAEKLIEIYNS